MRKRDNRRGSTTASTRSQVSAANYASMAGIQIPEHELNVMGFGNITRRFDFDEPNNGPSLVFRNIEPYAGFIRGFSNTSRAAGDDNAAIMVAADPKAALIPITTMADSFVTDVWPVLENLFSSGTGLRYASTVNEMSRYIAHFMRAYQILLSPLIVNHLTYHMDWTKVAPYTGVVPHCLYQIATNLDATDIGIAERYLPIMRRMDNMIAFPRMVAEMKRMVLPMMSVDLHGRMQVPLYGDPGTIDADALETAALMSLDYIRSHLGDLTNLVATFLPFPFREMNPWAFPTEPIIDIDRDSGWYNSGVQSVDTFGDTGDPLKRDHMVCDEADTNSTYLFTRHCQPIWAEVKLASIWSVTDQIDDEFQLETPHRYTNIFIIDDAFDQFSYTGGQVTNAAAGFRYIDYANCRFASDEGLDHGIQKPGTMGAEIHLANIRRLMQLETHWVFNLEALKLVTAVSAGAGLREIRQSIRDVVSYGLTSRL